MLRRYFANRKAPFALKPSPPSKVLDWASGVDRAVVPRQKVALGRKSGPELLTVTVSPLDFLNGSSDSNYERRHPFHHLSYFSSFNCFDDTVCLTNQQDLVTICIVDQQFHSCWLSAALASVTTKICTSVRAQTGGGSGSWGGLTGSAR